MTSSPRKERYFLTFCVLFVDNTTLLLSLVLCVGLCGCGDSSISNAKKSVDGMLSSLKSGEYDKMVSYMNTGALSLEESLDDMSKDRIRSLFDNDKNNKNVYKKE